MGLPRRSVLIGVATATMLAVGTPALAAEPVGVVRAAGGATAVPDSYIVVLKDSAVARDRVGDTAKRLSGRHGGTVARTYGAALRGFEVKVSASAAARIAADPAVAYVEQNHTVSISGTQANPPSWGLDRIDQRNLPLDSSYTYPNTASNVHAYIIDTGIRFSHNDFGGRATSGYDAVDGGSADDCNGHGTHVAGTVGGSAYGVAKAVQLVGVRVLNCSGSGTNAGVIAGVDWVTANAIKPAVANMSLGGGANSSLDNAVRNSIASGVTYGLAAGNDNGANACNTSPARTTEAITVGSTTSSDARSSFSNVGTCLDIFAPGSSITSAWYTSNTATNTISGTSMATPHVVGAAALVASANPELDAGSGPQPAGGQRDPQRGGQPWLGLAEPAALRGHRQHPAAAHRLHRHQRHRRVDPGRRLGGDQLDHHLRLWSQRVLGLHRGGEHRAHLPW